jgi:hypothetical protein
MIGDGFRHAYRVAQYRYDRALPEEDDPTDCYCGSPNDGQHGEDETEVCAECRAKQGDD